MSTPRSPRRWRRTSCRTRRRSSRRSGNSPRIKRQGARSDAHRRRDAPARGKRGGRGRCEVARGGGGSDRQGPAPARDLHGQGGRGDPLAVGGPGHADPGQAGRDGSHPDGAGEDRDGLGGVSARARSGAEMGRGDRGLPRPHGADVGTADPRAPSRPPPPTAGRIRITPVVARMAAEHGLDLSKIPGTGIDGRVTRKDVEGYIASGGAPPPGPPKAVPAMPTAAAPAPSKAAPSPAPKVPPPPAAEGDQVVPWTPIRKRIAEHMVRSKQTSPHVHIFAEVDMHRVAAVRAASKKEGVNLTYLPFVIYAAAKALREIPIMNAIVSGESTVLKKDIHIAVAVDTEKGLLVPVLRHADRMSLKEISAAVDDFGARAKAGKITPDELSGGTFSITNPGIKGNLFGTPIINQPQVGILRLGQIVKRPVVIDVDGEDSIVIRPMMYLGCAYDHRVIDGVAGNGFLYRVREILEAGDFP